MPLTARMIAPIALIMGIALAFVAGSAYQNAKAVVSANLVAVEATVVDGVSRDITFLLESSQSYIQVSARREAVIRYARLCLSHKPGTIEPDAQQAIRDLLKKSADIYTNVRSFDFMDMDGVVRVNSEGLGEGTRRADRDYFQKARSGKSAFQGPLAARNGEGYTFVLSEPVFVDGQIAGVLVGLIDMEDISRNHISPVTLRGRGFVYVIDPNGTIILHPDDSKIRNPAMIEQAVFEVVSKGDSGAFNHESDGSACYSTYKTLSSGWVVIATVSRDLLLTDLGAMRNGILLAAFLAVSFVVFAMFVILSRVVAALREGVDFAESVAAGNLDHTFAIQRTDELGALATALNTMVGRLKSSIDIAARRTQEAEEARASATSTSRELQAVVNSVDGGVARFVLDDQLHILWANPGFYALSGRIPPQNPDEDCGIERVHPADKEALLASLRAHASKGNFLYVEYRIIRTNGAISWVYMRAKRVGESNGYLLFTGVFVDITQQKSTIQALELELERYKVITEITDEILFDQDLVTNEKLLSANYKKIFGLPCRITSIAEQRQHTKLLTHPDALHIMDSIREALSSGEDFIRFVCRFKTLAHGYQWFEVCFKILRMEGKAVKLIGRMTNVHEKKLEEDRLRREAQTDMLSGLYNKITFEQLAAGALEGTSDSHALLIVDIDDFKKVNDSYGHPFGDGVITAVASTLLEAFRATDIIGRIGGDEFAVFARNVKDSSAIRARCRRLIRTLAELEHANGYRISVSVGISFYPEQGHTYPDLFAHADAALYQLKKHHGKGGFAVYRSDPGLL